MGTIINTKDTPKRASLSASKIKTLRECSFKFWAKYHLKLPEKNNVGALKGSICHVIFECLGNPRHKHHYDLILKENDLFASEAVKRLVKKHVLRSDLNKTEHVNSIKEMTMAGLSYDFFGKALGEPDESLSEVKVELDVSKDGISYKTLGFIDKLFLFKKKKLALIRDFKSSKKMFSNEDLEDSVQANCYELAVRKLYPEYLKIKVEFAFLQFMESGTSKGIQVVEKSTPEEMLGFEYILSELQALVDSFDEKAAVADMAANKGFTKGFGGIIMCGKGVEFAGQLKQDGTPKYHCPFKFPFDFYAVKDKSGKVLRTYFLDDADKIELDEENEDLYLEKFAGCPAWN